MSCERAEYRYLDEGGHVYLDYTGAGLPARSQLRAHASRLRRGVYGNPHSENPTSTASTPLVEQTRAAVLSYFNARPHEYAVIFTPNATGACHLVGESYPFGRRSRLILTADNHNSVNGLREYAAPGRRATRYVGLSTGARPARSSSAARAAPIGRGHGSARAARLPGPVQLQRRPPSAVLGGPRAGRGVRRAARRGRLRADEPARPVRGAARVRGAELVQDVRLPDRGGLPAGPARRAGTAATAVVLRRDDPRCQRRRALAPAARRRGRVRGRHGELPVDPGRGHRAGLDKRDRHRPDRPAGRLPDRMAGRLPGRPEARQRRADGPGLRPARRGRAAAPWR